MNIKFKSKPNPIKLYRNSISGHCHRVELMMAFLDLPYETIGLDMANAEHKSPGYLKMSPLGQVPAIDDNGTILSDSNAILIYLIKSYGDDYEWLPSTPLEAAEVQRWFSIGAGEIAYGPCAVRLVKVFGVDLDWDVAKAKTDGLFTMMEPMLASRNFLAGNAITAADVVGYTYISHAPEGGAPLDAYPNIRKWLERVEAHPGFVGMARSPLPTEA